MATPKEDSPIAQTSAAGHPEPPSPWGVGSGLVVGALLTLAALGIGVPSVETGVSGDALESQGIMQWVALNLGHSFWFFSLVFALYLMNLQQLSRLLRTDPQSLRVTELDQLSDVWMHLFVGIGVIWTAVGMRSALQAALGDAGAAGAGVVDSADTVLRKLVDGGILLALTTTIVGGVGGYLMRLGKTVLLGSRLQALFEQQQRSDVQALVAATERIESRMLEVQQGVFEGGATMKESHASPH